MCCAQEGIILTGISIDLNSIKPQEVMQANALKKTRTSPKTRFAGKILHHHHSGFCCIDRIAYPVFGNG
jgi:hypothetical protein